MHRDQQNTGREQMKSGQCSFPLLDLDVMSPLFWQNLPILGVIIFNKAVWRGGGKKDNKNLSFIFEGIGFAIFCRVLVGFGRLAGNGERQTASVRSWHQTVRCWRMGGTPKGGPHTETPRSHTQAHTCTAWMCSHTVQSQTYADMHAHTHSETLLKGAIETGKEQYESQLLHKISFQRLMQQSPPSPLHLCYYTEITKSYMLLYILVFSPPPPWLSFLHPCMCQPGDRLAAWQSKKSLIHNKRLQHGHCSWLTRCSGPSFLCLFASHKRRFWIENYFWSINRASCIVTKANAQYFKEIMLY